MDQTAITRSPAEIYDQMFVPALFGQWGPRVARAARVAPGDAVLDVGCGTGALALAVAEAAGPEGRVAGLDPNPEMLAVARGKPGRIDWREGAAEAIPFADAIFDAVVSQFAAMFFADRAKALAEMWRVLKPGGRLAVAVCGAVERSPGYARFARLLDELFGREVGDSFRAPFVLGDREALLHIATGAGIDGAAVTEEHADVRFRSIADLVSTERACVWTLGGILDGAQFDRLLAASEEALAPFRAAEGTVRFDMPTLVLTAARAA